MFTTSGHAQHKQTSVDSIFRQLVTTKNFTVRVRYVIIQGEDRHIMCKGRGDIVLVGRHPRRTVKILSERLIMFRVRVTDSLVCTRFCSNLPFHNSVSGQVEDLKESGHCEKTTTGGYGDYSCERLNRSSFSHPAYKSTRVFKSLRGSS